MAPDPPPDAADSAASGSLSLSPAPLVDSDDARFRGVEDARFRGVKDARFRNASSASWMAVESWYRPGFLSSTLRLFLAGPGPPSASA